MTKGVQNLPQEVKMEQLNPSNVTNILQQIASEYVANVGLSKQSISPKYAGKIVDIFIEFANDQFDHDIMQCARWCFIAL